MSAPAASDPVREAGAASDTRDACPSLPLCILTAVFELNSNAAAAAQVVTAYRDAVPGAATPSHTLSAMLRTADKAGGAASFAASTLRNTQRAGGRLKLELAIAAAHRLRSLGVERLEDLGPRMDDPAIVDAWLGVHGLGDSTWERLTGLVTSATAV